jgi:hypothetical protein
MTARMDSLIEDSYSIVKFADLPTPYQMAIVWRTVMECDGWEEVSIPEWKSEVEAKAGLALLLPQYVELYGEELFGTVTLSADALKSSVMRDEQIAAGYAGWDDYHADYTRGRTPKHPEADRWPVLLSYDDHETLWDGWHRLHSYIRDGAVEIPAVFNPLEHHLVACGIIPTPSPKPGMR